MTTRLTEIALSLERGEPLSGALSALDGWEARNIGAARMRAHVTDAAAQLRELASELQCAAHECDALLQELERRPRTLWQLFFRGTT